MLSRTLIVGLGGLLAACGAGAGWLGTGLVLESLLDPSEAAEDGLDGLPGLACYDLNANGECDEEEDWNGPNAEADGACDAYDCQGIRGVDGSAGTNGLDGADGEDGETPTLPPPVVIVVPPVIVQPDDEDDDPAGGHPPFGHGPDHERP
jgi:hypothetical protein